MKVKRCLCADGGDNCLSPKVFESDLIAYFSFDQQLQADDAGSLKFNPPAVSGPGYGLTPGSLYISFNNTYTVSGPLLGRQEAITISAWVYSIKRTRGWTNLLKKGKDISITPSVAIGADGTLEILVSTTKDRRVSFLSSGALLLGGWTHICLSVSLDAVTLYINGFVDVRKSFDEKVLVGSWLFSLTMTLLLWGLLLKD